MMEMCVSEVARLRKRIEEECQAMQQGFYGYAAVAKHEIIARRYDAIGKAQQELTALVGEVEAVRITVETYIQIIG